MFENKKVAKTGIQYSRYIASWRNYGSTVYGATFEKWLASEGCTSEEIAEIAEMATCGKMELEKSAHEFYREKHLNPYM